MAPFFLREDFWKKYVDELPSRCKEMHSEGTEAEDYDFSVLEPPGEDATPPPFFAGVAIAIAPEDTLIFLYSELGGGAPGPWECSEV